MAQEISGMQNDGLLNAFRMQYQHFSVAIPGAIQSDVDPVSLARLGDDLDEYCNLAQEVRHVISVSVTFEVEESWSQHETIFPPTEFQILMQNLAIMKNDIRTQYEIGLSTSHYGRPSVVGVLRTGGRGRPRLVFDPGFLQWAMTQRTTSRIASFLSVGRTTLRQAILDYGLAEPGNNPFLPEGSLDPDPSETQTVLVSDDDILEPELPLPLTLPQEVVNATPVAQSSISSMATSTLSTMTDDQLDNLLLQLKTHFRRAGITMLDGMLQQLGHRVPRDRIQASLLRIDPVHRVFNRIRIRRRVYTVPGPNSLWHHDGQHGEFSSNKNKYSISNLNSVSKALFAGVLSSMGLLMVTQD